jgi:hypothetical protein
MPPEQLPDPAPNIPDIDGIHSIDTARMALRWALERLRSLEGEKQALERRVASSETVSQKAAAELSELKQALAATTGVTGDREEYYKKLEEFLSLRLEGKLDPAGLAKREVEVQQLKELLDRRLLELGQDLAARKAALDRDQERALREIETSCRDRERAVERAYEAKSRLVEQQHLAKMAELREREMLLRQEEKAFAERQSRLEEHYAGRRAEVQAQLKGLREEIESHVGWKAALTERLLEERQTALASAWEKEHDVLQAEIETWKRRAMDAEPKVSALEGRLAAAEEAARQARAARDAQVLVFAEERGGFAELSKIHAQAAAHAETWKLRALELEGKLGDLEAKLAASEEAVRQAKAARDAQALLFDEQRRGFEQLKKLLEARRGA